MTSIASLLPLDLCIDEASIRGQRPSSIEVSEVSEVRARLVENGHVLQTKGHVL